MRGKKCVTERKRKGEEVRNACRKDEGWLQEGKKARNNKEREGKQNKLTHETHDIVMVDRSKE